MLYWKATVVEGNGVQGRTAVYSPLDGLEFGTAFGKTSMRQGIR